MFTTTDASPSPRRGTALMRALGAAFVAAVAIATLYPAVEWRLRTDSPLAFVGAGLPKYWTWFDVTSNVAAYAVLGLLLTLGWCRRLPAIRSVVAVGAVGAALSLGLEAAQSYLPNRVPSLLDWIANSIGALAGAALGATLNRATRRDPGAPRRASEHWYEQGPPTGWVLLTAWIAAQLVPQRLLFATGHVEPLLQRALDALPWDDGPPGLSREVWRWFGGAAPAGYGVAIEAATVICATVVVGALAMSLVRAPRARLVLLAGTAATAFALRSLATQMVYGSAAPFAWLTPGAQGGLVVGAAILYGVETLGPRARAACATTAAALGLLLVNVAPADRYFETTLAGMQAGRLVNLHGSLGLLSLAWPFLAIAWFWRQAAAPARRDALT